MFYYPDVRAGVVMAWRFVEQVGAGQLSNVSGFVLPEHRVMPDDEDMGSRDELVHRLLDIVELQARALSREAAQHAIDAQNGAAMRRLQEDPIAFEKFVDQAIGTYQPPKPKPRHRPHRKEYRVWRSFRDHFQKLERDIRRDLHLKPEDELSKEVMYANGGEVPRTMTRIMTDTHGLRADQWPPSTWPEESPWPEEPRNGQLFDLS